jgi:hypothetical protein
MLQVSGAASEHSLQMAFLLADVPAHAHSVPAGQSRKRTFHTTAMLVVILLERFCLLPRTSLLY